MPAGSLDEEDLDFDNFREQILAATKVCCKSGTQQ